MKHLNKPITKIALSTILIVGVISFTISPGLVSALGQSVPTTSATDTKKCGFTAFLGKCTPVTLNSIGTAAMKLLLKTMTQNVVDWINSGFHGSPTFLSNPSQFFTDMIDEELGAFIESNPDLNFLCSPIAVDVRLALQLSYSPFRRKISCTLSQVVNNVQNIPNNIRVNGQPVGMLSGSFSNGGGWNNFIQQSQNPQNNTFGAYMLAKEQADIRIANKTLLKRDELGQGKGFLSVTKCTDTETGETSIVGPLFASASTTRANTSSFQSVHGSEYSDCSVQTPGSVVNDTLSTALGSPFRQLELADEFDEIVNALISQLIQQVVTAGLSSISGGGSSDRNNYWNDRGSQLEQQQINSQIYNNKESIIDMLDDFKEQEKKYYDVYSQMYNSLYAVKADFENAIATLDNCGGRSPFYQQDILRLRAVLNSEIAVYFNKVSSGYNSSSALMTQINDYYALVDQQKNVEQLNSLGQKIYSFSNTLHTALETSDAEKLSTEILSKIVEYKRMITQYTLSCTKDN